MFSTIVCFLSLLAVAPPTVEDLKGANAIIQEKVLPTVVGVQGPPAAKCAAIGLNRQDCGYPGINPEQCAVKGCCYDALSQGPYCFYADEKAGTNVDAVNPIKDACCTYADVFRASCGEGLTQLECINKGCCFSGVSAIKCAFGIIPVAQVIAPQINQIQQEIVIGDGNVQIQDAQGAQVGECPVIAAESRKDCGFYGITKDECTEKNCCWGLLEKGKDGPVCYEKNAEPKPVGYPYYQQK